VWFEPSTFARLTRAASGDVALLVARPRRAVQGATSADSRRWGCNEIPMGSSSGILIPRRGSSVSLAWSEPKRSRLLRSEHRRDRVVESRRDEGLRDGRARGSSPCWWARGDAPVWSEREVEA